MHSSYEVSVPVAVAPERAWAFVGDPCSVPRWYPQYVSCEVQGDERRLVNAEGAVLVERLLERDEERRFYSYSIVSGLPLRNHLASFEVVAEGDASRVVWRTAGEHEDPAIDLEQRLAARQTEALGRLKALIEAGG
jgi:hypothetical protein